MKLKKTIFLTICLVIIFSIPTFAEANDPWEEKMDIGLETFEDWIETFKSEETPVEKRIIDYQIAQYGGGKANDSEDKFDITIYFKVTPVDEENTYWKKNHENICFIKMTKVDGEFKVDYISDKPENYDKFLEKFEEYQKNNSELIEVKQTQGEVDEKTSETREIQRISNVIVIVCVGALLIVTICIIIKIRRNKK